MRAPLIATIIGVVLALAACGERAPRATRDASSGREGSITGSVQLEGREDSDLTGIVVFFAGTNHVAFTDESGAFRFNEIPLGDYRVLARHEGFEQTAIGEVSLTAQNPRATLEPVTLLAQGPDSFDLPFPAGGGLAGVVRRTGGIDHGGINVALQGTSHATLTDSEGRWMLRDIPPGDYVLAFSAEGHAPRSTQVTVRPDQVADVPEQLLALGTGGDGKPEGDRSVIGTVAIIGPDETLLTDYTDVTVVIEGSDRRAHPDIDGHFSFEGLAPGVYLVSARGEGFVADPAQRVDLREQTEAEITLFLDSEEAILNTLVGSLRGRVVVARGGEPDGIPVAIAGTNLAVTTAADGTFAFPALTPGETSIVVRAPGFQTVRREGIEVTAGEEVDVGDITLEPAYPLPRVIASRPTDGQREVMLRPEIPILIEFSEPMNIASVKNAITMDPPVAHDMQMGSEHPQTNDRTLLISLAGGDRGVDFRDDVEVTIAESAQSVQGMEMEEAHTISFTMGRPGIYDSLPREGETLTTLSEDIDLYFNARIDTSDLAQKFDVSPAPPQVPYFFHEIDPRTGWSIVQVQTVFAPDTEYRIEANGRLRTATGARLGSERSVTFSTAPDIMLRDRDGNPIGDDSGYVY